MLSYILLSDVAGMCCWPSRDGSVAGYSLAASQLLHWLSKTYGRRCTKIINISNILHTYS